MNKIRITIFATLFLCGATPGVHAEYVAAKGAPPPAAKLAQCLNMPVATQVQKACIDQTEAAMGIKPQPIIPEHTGASGAAKVPGAKPAPPAPPDVKNAAHQMGLAGSPAPVPPGTPAAAAPPVADISGMDPKAALQVLQSQREAILRAQAAAHLAEAKARVTKMGQMQDASAKLKAAPKTKTGASGDMVTIGTGDEGAQTVANMKNAGLDTSKIKDSTAGGQKLYQASAGEMGTYKAQVDAKMASLGAEQQKQADLMQSALAKVNEYTDTLGRYIDTMAARNMVVGNMH